MKSRLLATFACLALSTTAMLAEDLPLGLFAAGANDRWTLYLGKEFPGAQGNLAITEDAGSNSGYAAYLEGAFGQGGAYVSINKTLLVPVPFKVLKFKVKTADAQTLMIRLVDSSNQTHQHIVKLQDTPDWQTVVVNDYKGERYAKWGGANDSKWNDPLKGIAILLELRGLKAGLKTGKVFLADIFLEK